MTRRARTAPLPPVTATAAFERGCHILRVVLPWPTAALSPNARSHRLALAGHRRRARQMAALLATDALRRAGIAPPRWRRATVIVRPYAPTRHRRDPDNVLASLKGSIDGVVDAGVLADDDQLLWVVHPVEHDPSAAAHVTITIIGEAT